MTLGKNKCMPQQDKDKNIVIRQTAKYSFVNYFGVAIGVVSNLLIYPEERGFLGLIGGIESLAFLLFPFLGFGMSTTLINFFPRLKENKANLSKFLSVILIVILVNLVLVSGFIWLISYYFEDFLKQYPSYHYVWYSVILAFFLVVIDLFRKLASTQGRIAFTSVLERFLPKVFLPLIVLLLIFRLASKNTAFTLYIISYGLIALALFYYGKQLANIRLTKNFKALFDKNFSKEVFRYSLFGFFVIFGGFTAFKIDTLMVLNLVGDTKAGVYRIASSLAGMLVLPSVGLFTIYSPIIAEMLSENKLNQLAQKYKLIAKVLFTLCGILFCCIFLGIDFLVALMPAKAVLSQSIPVIIILAISVLLDMATGFNTHIIMYSKYFRFNLYAILFLTLLNLFLNLFFIEILQLGYIGAAYATLVSMSLYNILKLVFIQKKLKMNPFSITQLKVAILFILSTTLIFWLPATKILWADLGLKVGLSLLINFSVILKLNWVPELNDFLRQKTNWIFKS